MRPRLLLMAALVGVIAICWLMSRSESGAGTDVGPGASSEASPLSSAALAEADRLPELPRARTPAVNISTAARTETKARRAARKARTVSSGQGTIEINVTVKETWSPIASVDVKVWQSVESDSEATGPPVSSSSDAFISLKTDGEGRARTSVPAGVGIRVAVVGRFEPGEMVTRDIAPLAPGEHRVVRIQVSPAADYWFHGRIVDARNGEPVAGVSVRLQEPDSEYVPGVGGRETGNSHDEIGTDAQGRFAIPIRSWMGLGGRIEAPGFAVVVFGPDSGHSSPETARVFELARAASIRGTVRHTGGGAIAGHTVYAKVYLAAR